MQVEKYLVPNTKYLEGLDIYFVKIQGEIKEEKTFLEQQLEQWLKFEKLGQSRGERWKERKRE